MNIGVESNVNTQKEVVSHSFDIEIDSKRLEKVTTELGEAFCLDKSKMEEIVDFFHDEMLRGLEGQASSLAMIPTFLPRWDSSHTSRDDDIYLALDFGGSTLRVLEVKFNSREGGFSVVSQRRHVLSKELVEVREGKRIFDAIAKEIKVFMETRGRLNDGRNYRMGFTFSFPFEQTAVNAAKILRWAKGFVADDVIGKDPVLLLKTALKENGVHNVEINAVLNDTTGTLLAGANHPNCNLGMILGTGTNICLNIPTSKIKKISGIYDDDDMIIVMESGNLNLRKVGIISRFDLEVEKDSNNIGKQCAEKLMSGKYLGEIFRIALKEAAGIVNDTHPLSQKGSLSTALMSAIETLISDSMREEMNRIFLEQHLKMKVSSDEDATMIRNLSLHIKQRSAQLSAMLISGAIRFLDPVMLQQHTVIIDGSVYTKDAAYQEKLHQILAEMGAQNIHIKEVEDGSGIGAAIAASVQI